jgi:hypothetical protein
MPYAPLKIPPGVARNGTQYQLGGRWFDANLVRWTDGLIQPIGGWQRLNTASTFSGACRGLYTWRDNLSGRYLAVGTSSKLYVWNDTGTLYDITPTGFSAGNTDSSTGNGFGAYLYGNAAYGTPRLVYTIAVEAATWTFDNWGEYLVGCAPHDGKIYQWTLGPTTAAAIVTNAPTSNQGVFVTPERYMVALGAGGDIRKVQWSDQEVNTVWTPSATNTAGDYNLQTSGKIRTAKRVRGESLIFTDVDVHSMTYLGPPFVYGFNRVGDFCGVAGPNAVAAIDSFAVWMSKSDFYIYDGSVRNLPCEVRDYVFSDFNEGQAVKVYAGANPAFNEIWWFYPSSGSVENDRYVLWNYKEDHWSIGQMPRTAWVAPGVYPTPYATSADGIVYAQENGWTDNGTAITTQRYAEAGALEIGNGDKVSVVRQIIPDEKTQGDVRVKFKARFTPNSTETTFGPYSLVPYTSVRFTGRQIAPRIEGTVDDDWRVGTIRLDIVAGSGR